MPILSCYIDDRTLSILQREAHERGRTVEQLAESAIENEAINADADRPMPAGQRHLALSGPDRHHEAQVDRLGGQPFHHGLPPARAADLKRWVGEERERDDAALGRESSIRPSFYESDME